MLRSRTTPALRGALRRLSTFDDVTPMAIADRVEQAAVRGGVFAGLRRVKGVLAAWVARGGGRGELCAALKTVSISGVRPPAGGRKGVRRIIDPKGLGSQTERSFADYDPPEYCRLCI